MKKIAFIFLFSLLLNELALEAALVKISFLDNEIALKDTADFLIKNGCSSNAVESFESAVRSNNTAPLGFDLGRFPGQRNGFYFFQSVSNLIAALQQPLIIANHSPQLNCFGNIFLLVGNQIQTSLKPDSLAGPFLASTTFSNFIVSPTYQETARDAFNAMYPSWYVETSKATFLELSLEKHMCLAAVFESYCTLPHSTTHTNFKETLLKVLQTDWQKFGIVFPTNCEVVICHCATLKIDGAPDFIAPFSAPSHAGVLFKKGGQFVYLEKAGSCGPYVRLDFADKKDLLPWLKSVIKPTTETRNLLFATFNEMEIKSLDEAGH